MDRITFLGSALALWSSVSSTGGGSPPPTKSIAGVTVPDTALAREAERLARAALPVEIYNHSLRTYLFAALIATAKEVAHDAELVYVASILHDTGMASAYMSDRRPFEVDGAFVARDLLAAHGAGADRQAVVWDAVALHDNGSIAVHKQPEVMLVSAGVGADFGGGLDLLTKAQIEDVLCAAPRTKFIDAFLTASAAVAKRKPFACAHSFVADVGYRRVPGFSLPNFCDEVKDDPFAAYTSGGGAGGATSPCPPRNT